MQKRAQPPPVPAHDHGSNNAIDDNTTTDDNNTTAPTTTTTASMDLTHKDPSSSAPIPSPSPPVPPPPANNNLFSDPFINFPTSNINTPLTSARHAAHHANNAISASNINNAFSLASPSPPTPARLTPARLNFNPDDFLISPQHHLNQPSTPTQPQTINISQRGTPELKRRLFCPPEQEHEQETKVIMPVDLPRDRNPMAGSTSTPPPPQKNPNAMGTLGISLTSMTESRPLQFPSQSPSQSPMVPFPFSPQSNYLTERSPPTHTYQHVTHNNGANNISILESCLDPLPSSSPLAALPLQAQPSSSPLRPGQSSHLPAAPPSPPPCPPSELNTSFSVKFQAAPQANVQPQESPDLQQNGHSSSDPSALFNQLPPSLQPSADDKRFTKLNLTTDANKDNTDNLASRTPKSNFLTPKMLGVNKSVVLRAAVNMAGNFASDLLATDPSKLKTSSALLSIQQPNSSAVKGKQTPSALITASGRNVPTTPFTPDPSTPLPTPTNPSTALTLAAKATSANTSLTPVTDIAVRKSAALPPGSSQSNSVSGNKKPQGSKFKCSCKASRCLKLYCLCFANSAYCSEGCSCKNCFNTADSAKAVHDARDAVLARDPRAFDPKVRFGIRPGLPLGAATNVAALTSLSGGHPSLPISAAARTSVSSGISGAIREVGRPIPPVPLTGTPASAVAHAHAHAIALGHVTPGPGDIHSKGCNCRKGCSKKYCVCRELNVECGPRCTCSGPNGCENRPSSNRHLQKGSSHTPYMPKNAAGGIHGPNTLSHSFLHLPGGHRHLQPAPTPPAGYTEIIADQLKGQRGKSKALKLLQARVMAEKKRSRAAVEVPSPSTVDPMASTNMGGMEDEKETGLNNHNGKNSALVESDDKGSSEANNKKRTLAETPNEEAEHVKKKITVICDPITPPCYRSSDVMPGPSPSSNSCTGNCISPTGNCIRPAKRMKCASELGSGGATDSGKVNDNDRDDEGDENNNNGVNFLRESNTTNLEIKKEGSDVEHPKLEHHNQRMSGFGRESEAIDMCRMPRILRVKMGSGRLYNNNKPSF